MRKKIYISALAGNLYINEYMENVLYKIKNNADIFMLSRPCNCEVYEDVGVRYLFYERERKKGIKSIVSGWKLSLTKVCRDNRPDVFIIHNANPWSIVKYLPLWIKAKRRILIFWGTDINEISRRNARLLRLLLPTVTDAGFTSETLRNVFLKRFGDKYAQKTHITIFGMPLYHELKKIREANCPEAIKRKCREDFQIPNDKIVIHIGYNAPKEQQHIDIIEALGRLPEDIRMRLYIIVPFGYGRRTEEYKTSVEEAIVTAGLEGRLLMDYYDKFANAKFRNACDVFIYGRTMDSHSFTPAEYMYAGARVIMPEWLLDNYQEIGAVSGYDVYLYHDFTELTDVIKKVLENIDIKNPCEPSGIELIRSWIDKNFSWEARATTWMQLLK